MHEVHVGVLCNKFLVVTADAEMCDSFSSRYSWLFLGVTTVSGSFFFLPDERSFDAFSLRFDF